MDLSTWVAFAVLETILCITPGPAVLFTVGSTLGRGRAAGFAAMGGIVTGNTIYFVLSATSLGAILLASYEVFTLVRWVGAAYLVYLGLRALFGKHESLPESAQPAPNASRGAFAAGTMTQLSNPKALIFFTALLPQFIDPHRWLVGQVTILGVTSQVIEALVMTAYILLASGVARSAKKTVVAGIFERVAGVFSDRRRAQVGTHETNVNMARIYENLADTFGNTPLVKNSAAQSRDRCDDSRENGIVQSGRQRQGPDRRCDDRSRGTQRTAEAGEGRHRADLR